MIDLSKFSPSYLQAKAPENFTIVKKTNAVEGLRSSLANLANDMMFETFDDHDGHQNPGDLADVSISTHDNQGRKDHPDDACNVKRHMKSGFYGIGHRIGLDHFPIPKAATAANIAKSVPNHFHSTPLEM